MRHPELTDEFLNKWASRNRNTKDILHNKELGWWYECNNCDHKKFGTTYVEDTRCGCFAGSYKYLKASEQPRDLKIYNYLLR